MQVSVFNVGCILRGISSRHRIEAELTAAERLLLAFREVVDRTIKIRMIEIDAGIEKSNYHLSILHVTARLVPIAEDSRSRCSIHQKSEV